MAVDLLPRLGSCLAVIIALIVAIIITIIIISGFCQEAKAKPDVG